MISDLEAVADWNPGVVEAVCGEPATGPGAQRTCRLSPVGTLHEVVSEWEPERALWFAVGRHGAIRSADLGLELTARDADRTTVRAVADYHLAFGPLGPVIDHLTVRRSFGRMLDQSLAGLKAHVEALPPPRPPNPDTARHPDPHPDPAPAPHPDPIPRKDRP